jgi:hypothetical protein
MVTSSQMEFESLIQGLQRVDPRLYQALMLLNKQMSELTQAVNPLIIESTLGAAGISNLPAPADFTISSTGRTVKLEWSDVVGATQYEVRKGTDWNTANFQLRISGLQANIDPLPYGNHTYLIKTLDSSGAYSVDATAATFDVTQIGAPSVSASVIDNNVLLNWSAPPSIFAIDHYIIRKDGGFVGNINSTFTTVSESVAGVYDYSVAAVDVAGNEGIEASVTVEVKSPPDFNLQDNRTSDLNGTRVNCIRTDLPSLICLWEPETWEEHYLTNSWLDIQDQLDAGYPIYIQPTAVTGSYEEVVDYGLNFNNVIVSIIWNTNQITTSTVNIIVRMAVSDDGITYTPFTDGAVQFFATFRYLKFRLEFTAEDDKAIIEIYNLTIRLDVKRENDGGEVEALASDVGGTVVFFNKDFKDVESITCTVKSVTEPYIVIFDFLDAPDPTSFSVYVFDTTGNRVSKTVEWKARGIV